MKGLKGGTSSPAEAHASVVRTKPKSSANHLLEIIDASLLIYFFVHSNGLVTVRESDNIKENFDDKF